MDAGYVPLLLGALAGPHCFTLLGLQTRAGSAETAAIRLRAMNLPGCPHAFVQEAHHLAAQYLEFPEYDPQSAARGLTWQLQQVLVAQFDGAQPHLDCLHRVDVDAQGPFPGNRQPGDRPLN